jgi:hypothetical protein
MSVNVITIYITGPYGPYDISEVLHIIRTLPAATTSLLESHQHNISIHMTRPIHNLRLYLSLLHRTETAVIISLNVYKRTRGTLSGVYEWTEIWEIFGISATATKPTHYTSPCMNGAYWGHQPHAAWTTREAAVHLVAMAACLMRFEPLREVTIDAPHMSHCNLRGFCWSLTNIRQVTANVLQLLFPNFATTNSPKLYVNTDTLM